MENKKIKNAKRFDYDNIRFKSTLEVSCYKALKNTGFSFRYEPAKFEVMSGFKLCSCSAYVPLKHHGKLDKDLSFVSHKVMSITYTPDFEVRHGNILAYFDVKGYPNDSYALKKKMFLKLLEEMNTNGKKILFFEPHSVKQMNQAIDIIRNYKYEKI